MFESPYCVPPTFHDRFGSRRPSGSRWGRGCPEQLSELLAATKSGAGLAANLGLSEATSPPLHLHFAMAKTAGVWSDSYFWATPQAFLEGGGVRGPPRSRESLRESAGLPAGQAEAEEPVPALSSFDLCLCSVDLRCTNLQCSGGFI